MTTSRIVEVELKARGICFISWARERGLEIEALIRMLDGEALPRLEVLFELEELTGITPQCFQRRA